jgi:hypothetical protein
MAQMAEQNEVSKPSEELNICSAVSSSGLSEYVQAQSSSRARMTSSSQTDRPYGSQHRVKLRARFDLHPQTTDVARSPIVLFRGSTFSESSAIPVRPSALIAEVTVETCPTCLCISSLRKLKWDAATARYFHHTL